MIRTVNVPILEIMQEGLGTIEFYCQKWIFDFCSNQYSLLWKTIALKNDKKSGHKKTLLCMSITLFMSIITPFYQPLKISTNPFSGAL